MSKDLDGVAACIPISFGYSKQSPYGVHWFAGGALREMLVARNILRGGFACVASGHHKISLTMDSPLAT